MAEVLRVDVSPDELAYLINMSEVGFHFMCQFFNRANHFEDVVAHSCKEGPNLTLSERKALLFRLSKLANTVEGLKAKVVSG